MRIHLTAGLKVLEGLAEQTVCLMVRVVFSRAQGAVGERIYGLRGEGLRRVLRRLEAGCRATCQKESKQEAWGRPIKTSWGSFHRLHPVI